MKNNKKINEIKNNIEKMEKDLAEQKKLVAKLEKETYEIGDEVKYKGFDWIVIKIDEHTFEKPAATLILKDKLSEKVLDELNIKHDSYGDIVFNKDQTNNKWEDSYVRECLINFSKKYLDFNDLLEMYSRLDENTESYDCIRLLTLREAENLPNSIRNINNTYWTMTPCYNTNDTRNWSSVFRVDTDGYLGAYRVNIATPGLRPVITLSTDELL